MIRKILTLLIALALMVSFAACGTEKTPEPESTAVPSDDVTATPLPSASPIPDKGTPPLTPAETPEPSSESSPTPAITPAPESPVVPTPESTAAPVPTPSPTPTPEAVESPTAVSCSSIWENIQSQMGGNMPAFMSGTAEDLLSLYGIESSAVEEFSLNMPMMMVHATEILIAKASPEGMEAVKSGIALRKQNLLDQWSTYLPEQYDLVEKAQIVTSGDYILFVIAADADTVVSIFRSSLG